MQYYWCSHCGYHGDFKFDRQRNVKCDVCDNTELTELDKEEYTEWHKEFGKLQDKNPFYKTKGKLNPLGGKNGGI